MTNQPPETTALSVSFSLRLEHVAKVSQLVEWLGENKSVVAQRAIETLYQNEAAKHTAEAQS